MKDRKEQTGRIKDKTGKNPNNYIMEGIVAANSSVLKIGDVLGTSLKIYLKNFGTFFGVMISGYLLYFAFMGVMLVSKTGTGVSQTAAGIMTIAILPAAMIVMISAIAGLNKGISDAYRGNTPTFTGCYSAGFKRFFRYMATTIFYTLAMMGGFLLLIIPGIVIAVKYSLSLVSSVLDDNNVSHMKYSSKLVKGSGWKIFLIFFVLGIVVMIPYTVAFFLNGMNIPNEASTEYFIMQFAVMLLGVIFGPFLMGILVVIYEKLREAKKDEVNPNEFKGMSTPAGCVVSGLLYLLLIGVMIFAAIAVGKIAKEKGIQPPAAVTGQQIK